MDKCDERRQLSVEQERALELIILGQNDREVAESLSIARQTVHKWRNYNPLFVANLNAIRQDLWDSQTIRAFSHGDKVHHSFLIDISPQSGRMSPTQR